MKRRFMTMWGLILYPTRLHFIGMVLALLCCIPILFPDSCPKNVLHTVQQYAGAALLISFCVSALMTLVSATTHMLRLSNTRAFSQVLKWLVIWSFGLFFYIMLAIAADVPPPLVQQDNLPIQASDILHTPKETLNGPSSLVIPIVPNNQPTDKVVEAPALLALEKDHAELFGRYIDQSPRWSGQDGDDTFYSKPGHLIMMALSASGVPALVHVCFRRLLEGDAVRQGFTILKPGDDFPEAANPQQQIPDIALDLGRNHLLLLAWRGSSHKETAFAAINAAIAATDARMQPLLDSPTEDTMQQLLNGRESYPGDKPEFRLCEPLAQEGAYQAELYANPGEPGVILVYIKDLNTDTTLRLLNCPARYSDNKQELFRHDIPGSVPEWIRRASDRDISNLFPKNTPLFAIRTGPQHQYFGVAFEVWFKPSDVREQRRLLIRRCYKVQSFDPPATENTPN